MKMLFIYTFIFIVIVHNNNYAHGEKEHEKNQHTKVDTFTVVNGDTIAVNGKAIESFKEKPDKSEKVNPFILKPIEAMFEHLHNKIVHFPIALSVGAFLLMFFYLKDERYRKAVFALILLAFLSAVGAYFTGEAQKTAFENTNKLWVAETHELLGIFSAISIFLWLISLLSVKYKKISLIMSLVTIALVLVTGFFGGVLAH